MIKQENKNQFFSLQINLKENNFRDELEESIELIFKLLTVKNEYFYFQSKNGMCDFYFFKSEERKRPGHVKKILQNNLPNKIVDEYTFHPNNRDIFYESVQKFKINRNWTIFHEPIDEMDYNGSDLLIFQNKENFYPWQKKVYNMIFDEFGKIKEADHRKVITIIDQDGCKGKSSFIKFLCWGRLDSIMKIGFGQSHQLRSSVINAGAKKVYIIDIPRSRGKNDNLTEIISAIEEISGGYIVSPMYGKSSNMMMVPPIIIVLSNQHLPYRLLSQDRWECYEITKNRKRLKKISIKKYIVKDNIKKQ